jgi:hypothetical protein
MGVLAVAMMATGGLFGDDKDAGKPTKGKLPAYWSKLGLSDEQKRQVQAIHTTFSGRIAALQEQLKLAQGQEKAALSKVLTQAQKDRLKELLAEKAGLTDSDTEEAKAPASDAKKGDTKAKKDSDKK